MIAETQMLYIEHVALQARQQVTNCFMEFGWPLEDTYACLFDPDITLQAAAGLITGGPVEPQPNLTRGTERLAGVLELIGETAYIYYESYDLVVRQRFSIGHELGHFLLHGHGRKQCQCSHTSVDPQGLEDAVLSSTPTIEREADIFAAALLMPQTLLRADVNRFGRCIGFLAARYRVSEPAMRRRLRSLGL